MFERLETAREVLSDKIFIFISIDNKEVFNIKLLCDNYFGEDNFIINLPSQSKKVVKQQLLFLKIMIMF